MKRHVASLAMAVTTTIAMVILAFIETSISKVSLLPVLFLVGWSIVCAIFFVFEEPRCRRHIIQFVGPSVPRPTVCEFKWGAPLEGPQNGPPCTDCGINTIVAVGPCTSLYWCANCRKNVIPGLAPTTARPLPSGQ